MTARRIGLVLLGCVATAASPARGEQVTVRVATYNIETFNGSDPTQLAAAAAVLARVGADVICVQEIASLSALGDLAEAAGYGDANLILASPSGDIDPGSADRAGVISRFPFLGGTGTETSVTLSGDPFALDLTRNFILVVIEVPDSGQPLVLTGNHWKAGFDDSDEFRRSVESIRAMQVVADFDSAEVPFLVVGDMNDDLGDSPDSPAQFFSLPGGLPTSYELGSDIEFPVDNGVFKALEAGQGAAEVTVINALQTKAQGSEPLDSTRPASGRRLDYLWRSDAVTVLGAEVYDSRDEGSGGLPKYGDPPAYSASSAASDHLLVFADIAMPVSTGACCHSGDVCVDDVDQEGCDALSGYYYGTGTSCDDELDPPCTTLGACCKPGGICDDQLDEDTCTGLGGYFYGIGTSCDDPLDPPCAPAGACCRPGGVCSDNLEAAECAGLDGYFYGTGTSCDDPLDPPCAQVATPILINEVLADPDGSDTKEYVELLGPPSAPLDGLWLVVIEGQTASKGGIDAAIDLTGYTIPPDGYFVLGDAGLSDPPPPLFDPPDLLLGASNSFENGSQTLLLVENYEAPPGDDVDADKDGTADGTIGTIVDAVGLVGGYGYPDYAVYFGAPEVGPQAGAFPGGVARIPTGVDTDTAADWSFLSRLLDGSDGGKPATPGWANAGEGDFEPDGDVDLYDFRAFQSCFTGEDAGPVVEGCAAGDLDADDDVDRIDLALFTAVIEGP